MQTASSVLYAGHVLSSLSAKQLQRKLWVPEDATMFSRTQLALHTERKRKPGAVRQEEQWCDFSSAL